MKLQKIGGYLGQLNGVSECKFIYNEYLSVQNKLNQCASKLEDYADDMKYAAARYSEANDVKDLIEGFDLGCNVQNLSATSVSSEGDSKNDSSKDNKSWWDEFCEDAEGAYDSVCEWFNEIDLGQVKDVLGKAVKILKTVAIDLLGGGLMIGEGITACSTGVGCIVGIPMIIVGFCSIIDGSNDFIYECNGNWDKVGKTNTLDSIADWCMEKNFGKGNMADFTSDLVQLTLNVLSLGGIKNILKDFTSLSLLEKETHKEIVMIADKFYMLIDYGKRQINYLGVMKIIRNLIDRINSLKTTGGKLIDSISDFFNANISIVNTNTATECVGCISVLADWGEMYEGNS